jgi:multidrug efflux pump subunit AcrA (membrane-fusion protein)
MRLLIEDLRQQHRPASGYTDVLYWFVTESTRLPTYARIPIDSMHRPKYPFCILASTWAQIMRAMVPRTDDLDGMLVGLLASPYVGYRPRVQGIGQFALERVLARVTAMADIPPTVAIAMVNDRAMASKIGEETDPDVVDRLVDEALSAKAAELEEQIARTAEEAAQAEQRRVEAESTAAQAEAERARLEAERNAALEAADAQRALSDQRTREQGSEVDQLRGELDAARSDITAEQAARATAQAGHAAAQRTIQRVRNTTAIAVAVVVGVAAAVLIAKGTIHGVPAVISTVAGVALIAYISLRLLSKDLANEFVLAITVVSSVVAIAGVFVHDTPSHHAAPKPTHGDHASTTTP